MGHWYEKEGSPCHRLPYADPSRGMRDTTLRDARKLGLSPSVSTITRMIPAPTLTKWIADQAVLSALTLKMGKQETEEAFLKRLAKDGKKTATEAADHGTAIHANIQKFLLGQDIKESIKINDRNYPVLSATMNFMDYWKENEYELVSCEKTFCHKSGYGGTVDIVAKKKEQHFVLDMKTKETRLGKEVIGYKENGCQLVAYRNGLALPTDTRLINLFISRNDSNFKVQEKEWTFEAEELLELFEGCFTFWKLVNKFDPKG